MRELEILSLNPEFMLNVPKEKQAPGQEEINVVFTDALNMADNHILIKCCERK